MARRKFLAPGRGAVDPRCFAAPLFDGFRAHDEWLSAPGWPALDQLDAALAQARHPLSRVPLRFAEQTAELLQDGLHYEQRIFELGAIATRSANWHDLFNALIWIEHTQLKAALNARQVADIARVGNTQRTRAQCALTHFDEAGAILLLRDVALLQRWDAHDWTGLFWHDRDAWQDGRAEVIVFGHALLEHALQTDPVHTAKCIAVLDTGRDGSDGGRAPDAIACVAQAIASSRALLDPQELRPLPLSGIPGWHPATADPVFYATAPCFRPRREGRCYPDPLRIRGAASG